MERSFSINKSTRHCELKVHLKNGNVLTGLFHVPAGTSSAVRPSDAIMEGERGFLLLSKVSIQEEGGPREIGAVVVPHAAIIHIELPNHWA